MPNKNGIQVFEDVKNYIIEMNQKGFKILEPKYVFLTAFMTIGFRQHLKSKGVT